MKPIELFVGSIYFVTIFNGARYKVRINNTYPGGFGGTYKYRDSKNKYCMPTSLAGGFSWDDITKITKSKSTEL